eukprot:12947-Rhodomonas_salina.1
MAVQKVESDELKRHMMASVVYFSSVVAHAGIGQGVSAAQRIQPEAPTARPARERQLNYAFPEDVVGFADALPSCCGRTELRFMRTLSTTLRQSSNAGRTSK